MSKKKSSEHKFNETFNETKNALLHYYTYNQTSQGARLVGFTLALFALIQIFQYSREKSFSGIIFFTTVPFLLFLIIRTIFRFAVFSYFSDYLIRVKPFEIPETEAIHDVIHTMVVDSAEKYNKRLYWVFPLIWFIAWRKEKTHRKGYVICLVLAIFLTGILYVVFMVNA